MIHPKTGRVLRCSEWVPAILNGGSRLELSRASPLCYRRYTTGVYVDRSASLHTRVVIPASIAGVTRNVW